MLILINFNDGRRDKASRIQIHLMLVLIFAGFWMATQKLAFKYIEC